MKRSAALRALSVEHHHALVLARRAREGAAGADAILAAYERELAPHFAHEEATLLPALERAGESALAERTRREHDALREAVAAIAAAGGDAPARRAAFGALLEAHVRFEERLLFPAVEARLDPADLAGLGARAGARPPARQES